MKKSKKAKSPKKFQKLYAAKLKSLKKAVKKQPVLWAPLIAVPLVLAAGVYVGSKSLMSSGHDKPNTTKLAGLTDRNNKANTVNTTDAKTQTSNTTVDNPKTSSNKTANTSSRSSSSKPQAGIRLSKTDITMYPGTKSEFVHAETTDGSEIYWLNDFKSFYYITYDGQVNKNTSSIDLRVVADPDAVPGTYTVRVGHGTDTSLRTNLTLHILPNPAAVAQSVGWGETTATRYELSNGDCMYTFGTTAHVTRGSGQSDQIFFTTVLEALDGPDASGGENPISYGTTPGSYAAGSPTGDVGITSDQNHPTYGPVILYPGASYKITFTADNHLGSNPQQWYSSEGYITVPDSCQYE